MSMTAAERSARYRAKDIGEYRKRKREWAKTPEQRQKNTEYMRKWRIKNKARSNTHSKNSYHRHKIEIAQRRKDRWLLSSYGITLADKQKMIRDQDNKCLICKETFKNSHLTHVDHDHSTGEIRGILCSRCNGQLGWYEKFKESIVEYLNI